MEPVHRALLLLTFAGASLVGFVVLPVAHATLWLIFLVVGFPVSVQFFSGAIDGVRFSPAELTKIYKESLNALPRLLSRNRNDKA